MSGPVQNLNWEGRPIVVTWLDPPFMPPRDETTQVTGICFTDEGQIVLVSHDGNTWTLPGGSLEEGETLEQYLAREVMEEVCGRVTDGEYLGCQRVDDPGNPEGFRHYYQTRFWARVELEEFRPEAERTERCVIDPGDFLSTLFWGDAPTAKIILARGIEIDKERRRT